LPQRSQRSKNQGGDVVIRFKCIYCGQRILARDDGIGKKGKCPKCKHELRVPKTTIGRPAISTEKTEPIQHPKDTSTWWNTKYTKPEDLPGYPTDDLAELCKEKAGWFIPIYDELSLFLMAMTLIFLCVGNSQMRNWILHFLSQADGRYILALLFLAGLVLSVYHVFTPREKNWIEKWFMMVFAVITNASTGIISGWYVIENNAVQNWLLLVFPIWNIINGALLLVMLRFRIIDEECISDRDATAGQVILGLIAVLAIFFLCNYVFKLYWAITFSICIVYATSFDKALQSVFPVLTYRENE